MIVTLTKKIVVDREQSLIEHIHKLHQGKRQRGFNIRVNTRD